MLALHRFDLSKGLVERFGEEVIEKVKKLGQMELQVTPEGHGGPMKFILTKAVSPWACRFGSEIIMSHGRCF